MTIQRLMVGIGLLATLGCGKGQTFGDDFSSISIRRLHGGLAYCPKEGMILDGSATRDDGFQKNPSLLGASLWEFSLRGTRATAGDVAGAQCLDPNWPDCMVSEAFGPVTLSATEVRELRDRVAAVPEKDCDTDPNLACDPCLVVSISVDQVSESDFCCGELNKEFLPAFYSLASYLDELAAKAR